MVVDKDNAIQIIAIATAVYRIALFHYYGLEAIVSSQW
jgi:hypothetical protein